MNEDKELEEAIKELQKRIEMLNRHIKSYEESNCKTNVYLQLVKEKEATEIVLKALENKDKTINKIKEESQRWLETSKAEMQEYGDNHEKYWKMFYELLNKIIKF